ncbi:MAG: lysostaphin resistance A-like protein [Vulcanococcus sp.]
MTAGSGKPPGWKQGLALLSLALSLLLWLNGLVDSLSRPSVGQALNLRQLELAVEAAPALPPALQPLLGSPPPLQALDQALATSLQRQAEAGVPAPAALRLERALLLQRLDRPAEAQGLLQGLAQPSPGAEASPEQRLAAALLGSDRDPALARWNGQSSLLARWSCEALAGSPGQACAGRSAPQRALARLLAVTLLPGLLLLLGVLLLLRELWLWRSGRAPAAPPLQGPPLSGLDAVLLIAGGFVVVGELLTPLLITPVLGGLLDQLAIRSPLREGLTVLLLYLALMAGPLLILRQQLRGLGPAPQAGWLQFRWRPLGSSWQRALRAVLMVLPAVSLVGWLQGLLWGDPGGSNPLLELVLRSQSAPALACFGMTAMVLAPLFEETLFRGVLLPVVGRAFGPLWGVLVSALVFAVAHLSLGELPPLLMLGLGLGWLRWNGGRLSSCVLMHGLWNGLTFANLLILGG